MNLFPHRKKEKFNLLQLKTQEQIIAITKQYVILLELVHT